jgi:hypothetical protein
MAAKKKTTRILVSTVGGPAFRWVSRENISERYGRVGTSHGKPVSAKIRQVEVEGDIKRRAVSAKTLREKYRPAPGGIFYQPGLAKPAPKAASKPTPKQAAKPTPDIEDDIRRDAEGIEADYNPKPQPTGQPQRQLPPQAEMFADPNPQAEQRRLTGGEQEAIKKYRIAPPQKDIPSSTPTHEELAEAEIQYRTQPQKQEDWIVVENTKGKTLTDEAGNPITDENGNPIKGKTEVFISPERRTALYSPLMVGGQQVKDSEGRGVYRRAHSFVSVPTKPSGDTQQRRALGVDTQVVLHAKFEQDGRQYDSYGYSHTTHGALTQGHGYTNSDPSVRYDEAYSSLKKNLTAAGLDYDNIDAIIEQARSEGRLIIEVEERTLFY